MEHLPQLNKFPNYPSHFPNSRFSPHLPNFPLLRPRLSIFPTLCSSPNLLLLSTSVQSDGSLVFKFGDTSEIPPVVENGNVSETKSDDVEIEVELGPEIDDSLAVNDEAAISVSDIDVQVEIESKYSAIDGQDGKKIVMESASDGFEVEHGNIDLVVTSNIEYSGLSDCKNTISDNDFSGEDSKLDVIENGFHVENLDNEATFEDEEIEDEEAQESVKEEMIKHDVDEVVEEMQVSSVQLEEEIEDEESVKEEMIKHDVDEVVEEMQVSSVQLEEEIEDEESVKEEMIKHDVDEVVEEMQVSSVQLEEEIEDEESVKEEMIKHDVDEVLEEMQVSSVQLEEEIEDEESVKEEMIKHDVDEVVEEMQVSSVQLEEEIEDEESVKEEMIKHDVDEVVADMEVSSVQLESTLEDEEMEVSSVQLEATLEDEETEDLETEDEESVKEEMIKHDVVEVVEAMEVSSLQLEVETVLDDEVNNNADSPSIAGLGDLSTDESEDAAFSSLEESEVTFAEAIVDSWTTPTVDIPTLSVSSASASIAHPSMVNDAVPSAVLQSDDSKESSDISEPAGPGPNSSGTASAEAILDREKVSRPSLCLVSAAASIAHSAEALAGGDDAYFVRENWFGVADGIGQWSFGGIDKGLYAQEFIQNCERLARKNMDTGLSSFNELLQQSAAMTTSSGAASVLIAHIADQVLHVANIGDSGFIIIRNRAVFVRSSPMCHEFNFPCAISSGDNPVEIVEEYHVELEEGDIIITATDGLFDNLYEHEIVYSVCKAVEDGKNLKDIAELLALRSQEVGRSSYVRTPFADAAQAAGHPEFSGGKFDHVTVIVSAVQTE